MRRERSGGFHITLSVSVTSSGPLIAEFPERVDSGQPGDLDRGAINRYRRSVPVTTMSTLRPPHREQTSRSRHSGTAVSAPYRSAISAASGSTWWPHALHYTISRTRAAAAFPRVIGGPGADFIAALRLLFRELQVRNSRFCRTGLPFGRDRFCCVEFPSFEFPDVPWS